MAKKKETIAQKAKKKVEEIEKKLVDEGSLRATARREVLKMANAKIEKGTKLKISDVYVTWSCWTLGNWKALIGTTASGSNYYEVTYDKMRKRVYVDEYQKVDNKVVDLSGK